MMGMVADFVNYLVARRLPKQTEEIDKRSLALYRQLQEETNDLLNEVVNKEAILGAKKNGTFHQ